MLAQLIVSGLASGSLYAMMAIGLILVYKTTHILNFGYGDMTMFSTFIAYMLLTWYKLPFAVAFLGAIACGFLLGIIVDRGFLKMAKNAPITSLFIATLGIGMILEAVAGWVWGYDTKPFPYIIKGPPVLLGSVVIRRHDLLVFAIAAAIALLLFAMFKFTDIGIAMRATAQNKRAARLMGINVGQIATWSWAIGVGLGALAGVLIAPIVFLDLTRMILVMIKAVAAAVLGGFTSLPGAIVGGLLLGVMENLTIYMPAALAPLKTTFVFLLIIIVLAIRPQGLLGESVGRRV
ncbi:MAG: branched-chain amino acid ABC transporter permease [Candidatus Acetothermia bacterium]|nr:branched-chain amino acid ABC transporter permease [Candidatus Acetothermia bacterium]MDH7504794.1 branched-chain amino acid ABC transporter permease [Candidatus Acetothermia bacterium]